MVAEAVEVATRFWRLMMTNDYSRVVSRRTWNAQRTAATLL
jgi:hypothetical protein